MTKFTDIPTEQFPLGFYEYNELMDQIRAAARGFARLRTDDGDAVDKALMDAWARLNSAWSLIQTIERRENAERLARART